MTSNFVPQTIDGPQAQPPGYDLLIAADTFGDALEGDVSGEPTWAKGLHWAPEQIGGGGAVAVDCHGDTADIGTGTNPETMTAEPFVVWADDHCSTLGYRGRDYEGRVRRQLLATQSFEIARELQLGAIRDADTLLNVALKDATVIHPGYIDPLEAAARLEGAIEETFKGRRGMLHMSPQILMLLHANYGLERSGQRWITPMGTIVAADAGYTHEADGTLYMYATGPVAVRLGRVNLNPGSFADADALGLVDWTTNSVVMYAERLALVEVDGVIAATPGTPPADAMFKIQLNVPPWATHS